MEGSTPREQWEIDLERRKKESPRQAYELKGNRLQESRNEVEDPAYRKLEGPVRRMSDRTSFVATASKVGAEALELPPNPTEEDFTRWVGTRRHPPPSTVILKNFAGRSTIPTPLSLRQHAAVPASAPGSPRAPAQHAPAHPLVSPRARGGRAARVQQELGLPLLAVKAGLGQQVGAKANAEGIESGLTELAGQRSVISSWVSTFEDDRTNWASKALFVEMRLRQALASSATLGGVPNVFRCAIACDCWERVAPLTGAVSLSALLESALPQPRGDYPRAPDPSLAWRWALHCGPAPMRHSAYRNPCGGRSSHQCLGCSGRRCCGASSRISRPTWPAVAPKSTRLTSPISSRSSGFARAIPRHRRVERGSTRGRFRRFRPASAVWVGCELECAVLV